MLVGASVFSLYIARVTGNCYGVGVVFCSYRRGGGVMDWARAELLDVADEISEGRDVRLESLASGLYAVAVRLPRECEILVTVSHGEGWVVGLYDPDGSLVGDYTNVDRCRVEFCVCSLEVEAYEGAWAE